MDVIRYFLGFIILSFTSHALCENSPLILSSKPVSCFGKSDGSITIDIHDSSIVRFEITLIDSLSKKIGMIDQNVPFPFCYPELEAGTYKVRFYTSGKLLDYAVKIESPPPLIANKINIEEIRGNKENAIMTIRANPSGGAPPYTIEWSENTNSQKGVVAKNLPMGVYRCTIDDSNHCGPVSATIFLFETEIDKFISNGKK